jgi:hypothetical protein
MRGILLSILGCSALCHADETHRAVDDLSQAAIQSAFQILRSDYIRSSDLTFDELNRAALQGLLERLSLGAELVKHNGDEKIAVPGIHAEMLPDKIAYLRPLTFSEKEVSLMAEKLGALMRDEARFLILDLRFPCPPGSFDVAAGMLENFIPRGELLFKMRQMGRQDAELVFSRNESLWTRPLIVLVDMDTNNVGETIAAVLASRKIALLVGTATRGGTVRYESTEIDENWLLRFARAEMLLPDDSSVFQRGLQPRFTVELPADIKNAIFKTSNGASLMPHIHETAPRRYSEADLVSGQNPDLDSYVKRSAGKATSVAPVPRDLVLQRAVDMLRSSTHLDEAGIKWSQPGTKTIQPPVLKGTPVKP